jgi:DNA invertase Pin-like site-specific DNA recombinase
MSQKGERNNQAKLNRDAVNQIRSRRASGESLVSIANDFGVSFKTISKVARNERWT